ncbi:MAG: HNH endonuclease [Oscillospiraceae bacterium]|nr:HNH endonuclease [Oscillospiraceae bacterium]
MKEQSLNERIIKNVILESKETDNWDTLIGFDNYEVNRKGKIRNRFSGREIGTLDEHGYVRVVLKQNGQNYSKAVHVLIATQYIPNPDNKPFVNHIDENRSNNCVENLEWVTAKENANHGERNTKVSSRISRPVNEYTLSGKYIRTWKSITAFANFYGVNVSNSRQAAINTKYKLTVAHRQLRVYNGETNDIEPINRISAINAYTEYPEVPEDLLYKPKSEHEEVMEAIERLLTVALSKKQKTIDTNLIKSYIEKMEKMIVDLQQK